MKNIENSFTENEQLLLARLSEGDHDAFAYTYYRYADILFAYGSRFGISKDVLEDAIQDVFYYIYTHRQPLLRVENLNYYLISSLKNRILKMNKNDLPTTEIEEQICVIELGANSLESLIEKEEQLAIKNKVELYLNKLTNRQREAVFLRYMKALSYEEIARILDMSVPSVRNLIFRGLTKIRKKAQK